MRKYKVLLSAYACEPNRGSEPGIGWNWAIEIAKRGHFVYVLTRANNENVIFNFFKDRAKPENIKFIYYDLPSWVLFFKKGTLGVNFYYFLWQLTSYCFIVKKQKLFPNEYKFDFVHHITFGVFRHVSLFYKLGIPFFFGPVGGGEELPNNLKRSFSVKYQFIESIRELINWFSKFNPFLLRMYSKTALIFCKTKETKNFIPPKFHDKSIISLEIGMLKEKINSTLNVYTNNPKLEFNILYVGRFLYWKGIDLAIDVISNLKNEYKINCKLTMIGQGNYLTHMNEKILKMNLNKDINIIDWIDQSELKSFYRKSNIFLFPSLHDSSGNVVLESLSNGLPVACLDLGGPSEITNKKSSIITSTHDKSHIQIVESLARSIYELYIDQEKLYKMKKESIIRASEFTWDKTIDKVYKTIESYMENNN